MKLCPLISHLLAGAAGLLLAAVLRPAPLAGHGSAAAAATVAQPSSKTTDRSRIAAAPTPREMLLELEKMPVNGARRQSLKGDLWREWAEADPLGFLGAFRNKALPLSGALTAFEQLARRNPEPLLQYARDEGCERAWDALANSGNPREVLALFQSQSELPVPADVFPKLFENGASSNASFYRQVAEIADPAARNGAFQGSAEILLKAGRVQEFQEWVADPHLEVDSTLVGESFAAFLAENLTATGEIAGLPADARVATVAGLVESLGGQTRNDERDLMTALTTLVQADWWGWSNADAQALERIRGLVPEYCQEPSSAWLSWATTLPEGASAEVMRDAVLEVWGRSPVENWKECLAALEDPAFRDRAAYALVLRDDLGGEGSRAEVVEMISDPGLREAALQQIAKESEDPFAE